MPSVIVLADEPAFALGALTVRPALRQVVAADSSEHILEPRVMQVLVALAKAEGGIVSRDRLIEQCWEGRIVGDDAINRVIGRLRQFAQGAAADAFRIETVPRVGYRLLLRDQTDTHGIDPPAAAPPQPAAQPNRRALLIGGAAAATLAAGGGAWWLLKPSPQPPPVSPEVAGMMARAISASRRGTPEGLSEAKGLLHRIVVLAPDYADGWGGLALVYAFGSHGNPRNREANLLQAKAATARAFALEPHNALATSASAVMLPARGRWLEGERILREGLRWHPRNEELWHSLAFLLAAVGRNAEAAKAMDNAIAFAPALEPDMAWFHIQTLWAANRLEEADAAIERASGLFPRQTFVWFSRCHVLLFTGRADQVLTLAADVDGRPAGIPDQDFDCLMAIAKALRTQDAADVAAAVAAVIEQAHQGAGYGENALLFLSALGHVDDAFAVAQGLYFDRGFTVGPLRFSREERAYTPLLDRRTRHLFLPPTRPMRRDARHAALVDELGLTAYWRKAGVKPDYQRGEDG